MEIDKGVEAVDNVVSLFTKAETAKPGLTATENSDGQSPDDVFETVRKRNEEVAERLRRERAKANRAVLRSYRIKT